MSDDTRIEDTEVAVEATTEEDEAAGDALLESLLVEEVSIDGMCGVY